MLFPTLTATYAGILGLIYLALSGWVVAGRAKYRINHGDGGNPMLLRRIRAHANFGEYVPLILLLMVLLEGGGASRPAIHALLLVLVVARLMHPLGMIAPEMSKQQFLCRGVSALATWVVLAVAVLWLIIRSL